MGYTKEEFKALNVFNTAIGQDESSYSSLWGEIKVKGQINFEAQQKRKDGTFIHVNIICSYVKFGEKELNCTYVVDITEKIALEKNLKLVDFSFRNAGLAMNFWRKDGTLFEYNEAGANLFGYSMEEFKNITIFDVSPGHTPESWNKRFEEFRKYPNTPHTSLLTKKDNSLVYVEVRSSIIVFEDLELCFSSSIDVTEKLKAEKELKESEKRYNDLFNLSPQPMWLYNPYTLKITDVNKATASLYGYSEQEFMNMKMTDIKIGEDIPLIQKHLLMEGHSKGVDKSTSKHYTKSKEIIELEIYTSTIIINDITLSSVVAIDVTEKNIQEQKMMKAIIKTQEDERYEIGGELHDNVCQILVGSLLNLGMVKSSLPAEKMQYFDECNKNIIAALAEIRNLSHRLAPAFFDDSTLEESFRTLFKTFSVGSEIEIELHFHDSIKIYPLSPELELNLYRILQEQLKNILKYAKASVVEVDIHIDNNKLKMKVSDNGIGFNVDTVRAGIGLANMKRRTELFSGIFEINSSPGNGCTILIDIPLDKKTVLN